MSNPALPEALRNALAAKCGSIVSQTLLWQRSLESARASGASEASLLLLLDGFNSSRTVDALVVGVSDEAGGIDGFLDQLKELVDESAFDLRAWLSAFESVESHLATKGRWATASSILGYLQCSAEFGGSSENRQSLPEIVDGMLEQYGFEGQEGCGTGLSG
ncbi:hypothetical protein [Pelagicoccus sp. SDUM812005]|uniref:hypothetical protein n=1 Tax=Pelagicoccus sp. SDUM812005 TaxID=3041257 RepID=UPI00280CDBDA|nr:hypothetical protein [Pelagicoccus sp. SDUM812005]MDQ8182361.1 hypothetical protein [Pelagicoccus sp. SDUM812005]